MQTLYKIKKAQIIDDEDYQPRRREARGKYSRKFKVEDKVRLHQPKRFKRA
jgi:hypothetical protein